MYTYRSIPTGTTQKATAEAIYAHLRERPRDVPADDDSTYLVFLLDGTETAIRVGTLTRGTLDVFPAVAPQHYIDNGWGPFWGDSIGNGAMIHTDMLRSDAPEGRERAIHALRLVVGRSIRYRNRMAKRDAATV